MIKKIISVLVFLFLLDIYCAAEVNTARLSAYNSNKKSFVAQKLATGEPITYCVFLSNNAKTITDENDFKNYVKLSFKLWTAYTSNIIRKAGREEELRDVLNALEKEPNLLPLKNCNFSNFDDRYFNLLDSKPPQESETADISFFYEDVYFAKIYGRETIPPHFTLKPIPHLVIPTRINVNHSNIKTNNVFSHQEEEMFRQLRADIIAAPSSSFKEMDGKLREFERLVKKVKDNTKSLFYVMLHETGHSIGLADQSPRGLDNADMIYSTVIPRRSVMDSFTIFPTCDDADGMVLLFDDALNIQREHFDSLCKDGISFSYGKESFKGEKTRKYSSDELKRIYNEDTKDTGVYKYEMSEYVNTRSGEETNNIEDNFDLLRIPKGEGGYQSKKGFMKILDFNDTENRISIGVHTTTLTLGAGAPHKQVLTEEFDDKGRLLRYTLEVYEHDKLIETKKVEK